METETETETETEVGAHLAQNPTFNFLGGVVGGGVGVHHPSPMS